MAQWMWWPARRLLRLMGPEGWVLTFAATATACMASLWFLPHSAGVTGGVILFALYLWWCGARDQQRAIRALGAAIETVAAGDLSRTVAVEARGHVAGMSRGIEKMQRKWSRLVADVRSEAQLVEMAGERLTAGARTLSSRTDEQATELEETAASVSKLLASVQANASAAGAAGRLASEVRGHAEQGITAVDSAVESVLRIEERSRRMSQIVGVIDGIAFQTNILALNAAVEAARAGETGRGFAVVAAEVRVLAQRSAQAAAEIKKLIEGSAEEVDAGVAQIRQASQLLVAMAGGVREVAEQVQQVAGSNAEQSSSLGEISQALRGIDELTRRNAQMVEASVQAAEQLRAQAESLKSGVVSMRLRQGCADEARALCVRAAACVREQGLAAAVTRFHDRAGPFIDRDMFVIVLDRKGMFRAFGADPNKANKPAVAAPGVDVHDLVRRTLALADSGGGWLPFRSFHPITHAPVDKLSYVLPVDSLAVMVSANKTDGDAAPTAEAPVGGTARSTAERPRPALA